MDKIRHSLIAIVGSIGVGLSQAAIAVDDTAPVTATATIDWSQLKLSVTGVNDETPTVAYTNQNTSLSSYASSL
jgi:hypothetical protein